MRISCPAVIFMHQLIKTLHFNLAGGLRNNSGVICMTQNYKTSLGLVNRFDLYQRVRCESN